MSDSKISEAEIKEILSELASVSTGHLKNIFSSAPANKTWEEIEERLSKGEILKDICELSDDYMESSYKSAKQKLEESAFVEAKDIFYNLCLFDQTKPKYWGGLGKCCEGLKEYKQAIESYKMLTLVTGGAEPLPYLCLGYCHLKNKDKQSALEVLEEGKDLCDPYDHEQRPVLEQFENLISICNK
jgi:tetratricopeptide (TPR) repeat protein